MDLSVSLKNKPLPAPAVLPAAERSEPERSEGERSAAAGKTVAELRALPRPDPEVVARPAVPLLPQAPHLQEADNARFSGTIGPSAARGLYSYLVTWRRTQVAQALTPPSAAPSQEPSLDAENQKLRRGE